MTDKENRGEPIESGVAWVRPFGFQANVGTLVDGQPATAAINSAGITAIQTALGQSESKVQLRLQYTVDDNNNSTSDYQGYYSASTSTGGRHPTLIIHYTLAD